MTQVAPQIQTKNHTGVYHPPLAALRSHSLFADMSDEIFSDFSHAAQELSRSKGAILFMQDDPAEWFYFIVSGWVKLFRETLEGDEAVIDVMTSGHIFGETAILDGGIHTMGASAVERTVLIRLPASLLKSAITKSHDVALGMLASISRHRRQQTQEIENLNMQNAPQRIGCFLLRLCRTNDIEAETTNFNLPYDKSLIAARLGMQCETFSRALNKLRKQTNIDVKGAAVTIPDVADLSEYVCGRCSNEYPCSDLH